MNLSPVFLNFCVALRYSFMSSYIVSDPSICFKFHAEELTNLSLQAFSPPWTVLKAPLPAIDTSKSYHQNTFGPLLALFDPFLILQPFLVPMMCLFQFQILQLASNHEDDPCKNVCSYIIFGSHPLIKHFSYVLDILFLVSPLICYQLLFRPSFGWLNTGTDRNWGP